MDVDLLSLRIILNTESIKFPLTGIGRYTYELAKALQTESKLDCLRFLNARRLYEYLPEEVIETQAYGVRRLLQRSKLVMEGYRLLMPYLRAKALAGYEDCIYHSPNFFLPKFDGQSVATFHDLSPFTWAQCHDPIKVRYLQKELRITLDRADRLITDSEFTKQELIAFSGWSADKIDAISLAAGPEFYPRTETEIEEFLKQYQLNYRGFTLFVGTIEPRKNIISLLDAYSAMPKTLRLRYPLILAGYKGWSSLDIHQRIERAEQEGWARYLGFLPAQELPKLFSAARLFAFPSHYEGFGLPVLEAMQSGVPVVCSNSASLPEVTGDAALTCDALDIERLTEYLIKGLQDNLWRKEAIAKGIAQSGYFSWQRCAQETYAVYNKLKRSCS